MRGAKVRCVGSSYATARPVQSVKPGELTRPPAPWPFSATLAAAERDGRFGLGRPRRQFGNPSGDQQFRSARRMLRARGRAAGGLGDGVGNSRRPQFVAVVARTATEASSDWCRRPLWAKLPMRTSRPHPQQSHKAGGRTAQGVRPRRPAEGYLARLSRAIPMQREPFFSRAIITGISYFRRKPTGRNLAVLLDMRRIDQIRARAKPPVGSARRRRR